MRPRIVALLLFVVVALGIGGSYPWIHRHTRRSELEVAASNFCACMMGQHSGDVTRTLEGVRMATLIDPPDADRAWPKRCAPFAQAVAAVEGDEASRKIAAELEKGNEDSAADLLDVMQLFWVNEPAPSVPLAPPPIFPRVDSSTPIFYDGDVSRIEFGEEGASVGGSGVRCTIDEDYHSSCGGEPRGLVLERDPGAPDVHYDPDKVRFVRADGSTVGDFAHLGSFVWGHVYAGDRIVAVDDDGTIWEHDHGKMQKKEHVIVTTQRSTRFVDGWALWKDTSIEPAIAVAWKLSDGVRGNRIPLGIVTRPPRMFGGGRTYGVCRSRSIFVDLDPNLVVLTNGVWRMIERTSALNGRHIDCNGDSAIVTDFHPPDVQRCTQSGCVAMPLPPVSGNLEDEFLATEDALYQIDRRGAAVVLSIHTFASGAKRRIPLTDSHTAGFYRLDDMLHVSHGRVLVTIVRHADKRVVVLAVDRDGSTRVLRAGE